MTDEAHSHEHWASFYPFSPDAPGRIALPLKMPAVTAISSTAAPVETLINLAYRGDQSVTVHN
jgi:hypothetical protein